MLAGALSGCKLAASFFEEGSALQEAGPPDPEAFGLVVGGELTTRSATKGAQLQEIREQLQFTTAALRDDGATVDFGDLVITIDTARSTSERVVYDARFGLRFTEGRKTHPERIAVVVPNTADKAGRQAFFDAYAPTCAAPGSTPQTFWLHFRTATKGCAIEPRWVKKLDVLVAARAGFAKGRAPEYAELWKDQRLDVAVVFAGRGSKGEKARVDQWLKERGDSVKDKGVVFATTHVLTDADARSKAADAVAGSEIVVLSGDLSLKEQLEFLNEAGTKAAVGYRVLVVHGAGAFPFRLPDGEPPGRTLDLLVASEHEAKPSAAPVVALMTALTEGRARTGEILGRIAPDGRGSWFGDEDNGLSGQAP